jgi:hypothetical protein
MKKYWYLIVITVLIVIFYFVFKEVFPKEASRYPLFVVLLLLDVYLWMSVRKRIFKQSAFIKYLITFLYWFPLLLLIILLFVSIGEPVRLWDSGLRTYSFGIVFVAYISKLFTIIFLLISDLLALVRHIWRFVRQKRTGKARKDKTQKITRSRFIINLGLITGGIAFSGMLIGMLRWVSDFKVRRVNIKLPELTDEFDGLKIVQISDLHLGSWSSTQPMKEAALLINELKPDMVFFTGDLVNFATNETEGFEEILSEIKAPLGVYAVLGNHDYGDYSSWNSIEEKEKNMQDLYDFYENINWQLLLNKSAVINMNGECLAIVGVENWSANKRFVSKGDIEMALQGTENCPVKLLLSHDPSHWEKLIRKKHKEINVTFSGHTHGFQFGIEVPGFKWSPAQYLYKQWAGLYKNYETGQYIYVNRGTGFIGYPGRIGILPEISLITLEK